MKVYGKERCLAHHSLQLGTSWKRVVNFTHGSLYPLERIPELTRIYRVGRPHSKSGHFGEEKNLLALEKPHIIRIKKCFLELRFLNSEGYYR
jgi:hypothetical protein